MFIDANKILELIDAAKRCVEVLPEDEQYLHYSDVAGFLQKLIDDEVASLKEMAAAYEEEEKARQEIDGMIDEYNQELIDFDDWMPGPGIVDDFDELEVD